MFFFDFFCAGGIQNIFWHWHSLLSSLVLFGFVLELCEHDLLALAFFCCDQEFLCFQKEESRITGTYVTVSFTSHQKNEGKASESLLCAGQEEELQNTVFHTPTKNSGRKFEESSDECSLIEGFSQFGRFGTCY